jgi:phosphoenolpyruvate synthase/pyruvate phosphate dikinase
MRTDIHGHRDGDARSPVARHDAHEAASPDRANGFVCWLSDVSDADARRVGALGASLGELTRTGAAEPGFVVTTDAYLRALDQFGGRGALHARIADVDLHDPLALSRAAKTCQALVRSVEMPAAVQRSVLDAYTRLGRDAGHAVAVTVRSSPSPGDPASTASAGMNVSFTDVRGGLELVDRIIDCWAARWSPRVVAGRAAPALKREPAIAVVVQRLPGSA